MTSLDDQLDALMVLLEHDQLPPMPGDEAFRASAALRDLHRQKSGRRPRDVARLEAKYRAAIPRPVDFIARADELGLLHSDTTTGA